MILVLLVMDVCIACGENLGFVMAAEVEAVVGRVPIRDLTLLLL